MSNAKTKVKESEQSDFLDAEQAAHELVEALQTLEVDVKGYRSATAEMQGAASAMGGVAEATAQLTSNVADIGKRAADALDVLVAIGGPEILAQLAGLNDAQLQHTKRVQELEDLIRHTGGEMERLRASAQAAADVGEHNRLAIAKVEGKVASSVKALGDKIKETVATVATRADEQAALLEALSSSAAESEQRRVSEHAQVRSFAVWATGLAATAVLLSSVIVILLLK